MLNTFLGGMCNGSEGNAFIEEECTGDIGTADSMPTPAFAKAMHSSRVCMNVSQVGPSSEVASSSFYNVNA